MKKYCIHNMVHSTVSWIPDFVLFVNDTSIEQKIKNYCWRIIGTDGNSNFTVVV